MAENGTCCGVLKEGPFFDGKYSKLRKVLIDNYNVTDVISVPQNAFENTGTKTSIIIFHNNGKTKKVNFSELIVNLEKKDVFGLDDKGFVKLTKIKDEIIDVVEHKLCTATYKQISDPTIIKKGKTETKKYDYSLNYKNYMDYKVFCPDGYELKKLGDLCDIEKGYAFKGSEMKKKGIRIIKQSNIINNQIKILETDDYVDETDIFDNYILKKNDIILCLVGGIENKMAIYNNNEKMYLNQNMCKLSNFKDNDTFKYILYYLFVNFKNIFENYCKTSIQNSLNKNSLVEIQIPVPINITKLKKPLESLQKLHQQITQDTEAIPAKEKAICELIKKLTDEGREGVDYDSHKLGDVCEIKCGTRIIKNNDLKKINDSKKNNDSKKLYPVYGGGDISFYTDKEPNRTGENCIIGRFGLSKNCVRIIKGNIFLNDSSMSIHYDKNLLIEKIIWYNLINKQEYIYINLTTKSVQTNINMEQFKNYVIMIPKEKTLKKYNLQELINEVDQLKDTLESNKKQHQDQINKLFENFKEPEELTNNTKTNNNIQENNIPENTPEETPNNTPADTPDITPEEDSEEAPEEEPEYETIEHEGKKYYLDGKKVYRINKDKSLGKYYGRYKNDKVIRASEEANKEEKKIVVKAKANVKAKE